MRMVRNAREESSTFLSFSLLRSSLSWERGRHRKRNGTEAFLVESSIPYMEVSRLEREAPERGKKGASALSLSVWQSRFVPLFRAKIDFIKPKSTDVKTQIRNHDTPLLSCTHTVMLLCSWILFLSRSSTFSFKSMIGLFFAWASSSLSPRSVFSQAGVGYLVVLPLLSKGFK